MRNTVRHAEITKYGHKHTCDGRNVEIIRTCRNKGWATRHTMEKLATGVILLPLLLLLAQILPARHIKDG